MSRTFTELLDAMSAVAGKDEEARALVRQFDELAAHTRWESATLPTKREAFHIDMDDLMHWQMPVFMVSEATEGERDDPLVWPHGCWNDHTQHAHTALFVDSVHCHPDWLGLKAISEFSLHLQRLNREELMAQFPDDSAPMAAARVHEAYCRLVDRRWAMIYRLVDAKLKGRIRHAHKEKYTPHINEERLLAILARDVSRLYRHAWPPVRTSDERAVREEIAKWTAGGVIASIRFDSPLNAS